jgi:hypothetical protein
VIHLSIQLPSITASQAYFAHRVWAVSKKLHLALVAWTLILARIVVVSTTLAILGRTSIIFVVLEYRYLIDVSLALAIIVRSGLPNILRQTQQFTRATFGPPSRCVGTCGRRKREHFDGTATDMHGMICMAANTVQQHVQSYQGIHGSDTWCDR